MTIKTAQDALEKAMSRSTRLDNGCLFWNGAPDSGGYAQVKFSNQLWLLHRLSYFVNRGDPGGMVVGHRCHDESDCDAGKKCLHRRCWEPTHLYLQTGWENTLSGKSFASDHAAKTHCPQGHPYDAENTYLYQNRRYCRACNTKTARRALAEQRSKGQP